VSVRELEDQLRRLAINDVSCLDSLNRIEGTCSGVACLDPRAASLVRLAVLVALDGPSPTIEWATSNAIAAGVTDDEVVGVLATAAPLIGTARVVAAAPRIAGALGYDIDAHLESLPDPR
jgi:4-carboxymuconolactone decarboxylase